MPQVVAGFQAAGAAIGGAFSAFTGTALGSALLQLGASAALSAIAQRGRRSRGDQKRELAQPSDRPPQRFVYGRVRMPGSPVRFWTRGRVFYALYILNSRPSAGGSVALTFDERASDIVAGDPFDFAGTGARVEIEDYDSHSSASDQPHVWIGRGEQTGPPAEILSDLDDELLATDALTGLTVMWVRLNSGGQSKRFDRWPRTPPAIEAEMDWSLVWDPRESAQDPEDPDTWVWSNNAALVLLDAALRNPIRRQPLMLTDIAAFERDADIADEAVPLKGGGDEPRYRADGFIVWRDTDLLEQLAPIADASGGGLARVGGVLTTIPGKAITPSYEATDLLGDEFEYEGAKPGSEIPVAVRASYVAPDRGWTDAELPALAVGAGGTGTLEEGTQEIPLPFVTSPTQAMRLQKMIAKRLAAQRRLRVTLPPDAVNLIPGSVATWDIPALSHMAGRWRVERIDPQLGVSGDGVALLCPVELAEDPADVDAWDPETDEFELATEDFTPPAPVRVPPDDLTATTGPGVASGNTPRIRFSFEPVAGNVVGYEWQWRETGDEYAEGGQISADVRDGSDKVFGFLVPVDPGTEYQIRVRTIYLGAISDWTDTAITAQGPDFDLDPPHDGAAIGGDGEIQVSFVTPNNIAFEAIEFWGGDTDDLQAASLLDTIASAPSTVRTLVEDGLGGDVTRHYWARSRGPFGSVSDFSDRVSATTDP